MKNCGHRWECGCDKPICEECEGPLWCNVEGCKNYYTFRNDNCNCNGPDCYYCQKSQNLKRAT